jgi:ornithine--oxo-acid transaminase
MTDDRNHSLSSQGFIDLEKKWGAHNYYPLPVTLTRGQGVWLWDVEGKKYLDMMSAYSAVSFGHCHPKLLATLTEQAGRLPICSRAYYTDVLPLLLEKLCAVTGMDRALPMNTGAEAVETAVKAVRRWGYFSKQIPQDQAEIIVMRHNFHGRTSGIISFSSEPSYKKGFGPFLPGFKEVLFGDAAALEKAITPHTCAVLTEPIQGEAGIILPPEGWLAEISKICQKNNVLLIVDEVQSGFGRTGKMFACWHENVQPDGMVLGKALGGGFFPVSALVGKEHLMQVFTPGSHGSTFGGNPLGAAIALRVLHLLEEESLPERSTELGVYFMRQLETIKTPLIRDLRGKGLWIGIDLDPAYISARAVCEKLKEHGVLSKETHETVVRLAPPLVITKEELDWGIQKIKMVLESISIKNCEN